MLHKALHIGASVLGISAVAIFAVGLAARGPAFLSNWVQGK